jgi:hypothetical protein
MGPPLLRGSGSETEGNTMNILFIVVAVIAVILLFTGGFVQSLNFLLWVGLVLLILAVIAWLIRSMSGRRNL